MARYSPRFADALLRKIMEPLLSGAPLKLSLDTGRRLTRVELITIPAYCKMVATVPPGAAEVRFENMPACQVEYVDYYDQNGVRIIRIYLGRVICRGETITAYTDHIVSAT
jgi:hypothetical protein